MEEGGWVGGWVGGTGNKSRIVSDRKARDRVEEEEEEEEEESQDFFLSLNPPFSILVKHPTCSPLFLI